jgi:branched-subunit amino acid ABC-type transport system permease component
MSWAGHLLVAVDGLAYGMVLFVVAAGLTLSLGAGNVLNLAHGAAYLAGAYLAWWCADGTWTGTALGLAWAIGVGATAGVGISILLRQLTDPLGQALASIGVALIAGQLLTSLFGAEPLSVDPPAVLAGDVGIAGRPYPTYRLALVAIAVPLAVALWWTVNRTRAGALIRATGEDPDMVAALGIEPHRVHAATIAAGTVLATTAGVLGAPLLGPAPGLDHTVLVLSLVIVIAGGLGSVGGALVAALAVGQVQTTGVTSWPAAAPYLAFAVLAAALVLRATFAARRARTV